MSVTVPPGHDSVVVPRFLLGAAAAGGADARQMARDARLPSWALAAEEAVIPTRHSTLLWEMAEHTLEDPDVPLTIASRHRVGQLDFFDYLFSTAATVRDGLQATMRFLHLLTTNERRQVEAETERETTYSYRHVAPGGRGEQLCLQFAVAVVCARARAATGQRVVPVRVAFAQPPPRTYRPLIEALGTRRIEFGAPVTTFTLRAADLDLPLRGADPALAEILARYAATLPPPPVATWPEHFRQVLSEAIRDGTPSLGAVARRLAVSPRTLQRQLAAHGTTWRAELERARQALARHYSQAGPPGMARLARQLGYGDPRSVRRALRRWDDNATELP
jgi:AraC-like DNA-binding protein